MHRCDHHPCVSSSQCERHWERLDKLRSVVPSQCPDPHADPEQAVARGDGERLRDFLDCGLDASAEYGADEG